MSKQTDLLKNGMRKAVVPAQDLKSIAQNQKNDDVKPNGTPNALPNGETNASPNGLPNERTNETSDDKTIKRNLKPTKVITIPGLSERLHKNIKLAKRDTTRYSFEIYVDQKELITDIITLTRRKRGEKVTVSEIIRDALDTYLNDQLELLEKEEGEE